METGMARLKEAQALTAHEATCRSCKEAKRCAAGTLLKAAYTTAKKRQR
jgi:hypothetical protein